MNLLVFYAVYSIYIQYPWLAHILVFGVHIATALLLFNVVKRKLRVTESIIIAVLYIVFPFFTEQYGWFAASNATVANLVLMLQLFLLTSNKKYEDKIKYIFLLQLIGVHLYESVFLTFIPIWYYLVRTNPKQKLIKHVLILGLFSLPSIEYVFIRDFILVAHVPSTVRELGIASFLNGTAYTQILSNISLLIKNLIFLFLLKGPQQYYWQYNFIEGAKMLAVNAWLMLMIINDLIIGIFLFLITKKTIAKDHVMRKMNDIDFVITVFLIAIFSMIPNLLLTHPSFPFRTLALPIFFLLLGIMLILSRFKGIFVSVGIALSLFFIVSTTFILHSMSLQSWDDERFLGKMVTTIDKKIANNDEQAVLELDNYPNTTRTYMIYGEYLGSCLSTDWCLQAALNQRTSKVEKVFINSQAVAQHPSQKIIRFVYNQERDELTTK